MHNPISLMKNQTWLKIEHVLHLPFFFPLWHEFFLVYHFCAVSASIMHSHNFCAPLSMVINGLEIQLNWLIMVKWVVIKWMEVQQIVWQSAAIAAIPANPFEKGVISIREQPVLYWFFYFYKFLVGCL